MSHDESTRMYKYSNMPIMVLLFNVLMIWCSMCAHAEGRGPRTKCDKELN